MMDEMWTFIKTMKFTLAFMLCYGVIAVLLITNYRYSWQPSAGDPAQGVQVPKVYLSSDGICENDGKGIFLLIMILSAVLNFDIRKEVRSTYANVTHHQGCAIRHVFLLARTDYVEAQEWVRQEARQYGDVVQFDFDDMYINLARKTTGGLFWVNSTCNLARYILKTDDDMLVLPQNAVRLLSGVTADQERTLYTGRLQTSAAARPVRTYGKWTVRKEIYPYLRYPPYIWGLGIILSQKTLQKFLTATNSVPQIHIEDAYIGLLARATGVKPYCSTAVRYGFKLRNHSAYSDYCRYQNLMVLATSLKDSERLWKGYTQAEAEGKTCKDTRTDYFYKSLDLCPWPWVAKTEILNLVPKDDGFVQKTCASFNAGKLS